MSNSESPVPVADPTSSPELPSTGPEKHTRDESDMLTGSPPAEAVSVVTTEVRIGGTLGGYRLLKKLGEGGMGYVFEAEDARLKRHVAMKVMKPDVAVKDALRQRFLREAQAAAAVEHDHIVPIHQVGEEGNVPFIVMPFLKGEPLDVRLKRGRLDIPEIITFGRQAAEGLAAAHEHGLIHRDIKPANIWLETTKTMGTRVRILDFGLARISGDEHLTQSGAIMGTPAYMAPEQARGWEVDARADLFSLGCVLYEMTTGKRPFTGSDAMAILSSLALDTPTEPIQLNPQLPPSLSQITMKLLEKDAAKRPASAKEVAETLKKLMPESTVVVIATKHRAEESSPWADIDASSTEIAPPPPSVELIAAKKQESETPVARRAAKPRQAKKLLLFGAAGLLALAMAFIIIKITNKDGSVTELKVPDGSKVEVVDNGKTTVVVDPKPKKDPITKVEPKKLDPVNPPSFVLPTFDEKEAKKQQEEWATKLKLPAEATNKLGMKMMLIPPAGLAIPKAYYLGKYEVTQGEWTQVMGYNPSGFSPKNAKLAAEDTSKFPVENVSWFDGVEFCNKLSEQESLKPYYDLTVTKRGGGGNKQIEEAEVKILGGSGYHIPTDAEWTWGCAAGAKTRYHFGDKDNDLPEYAWFKDNNEGRTHAVGEKKPNAFGLHDMHGNVREWNEEMLTNAATGAPGRVARGGDWAGPAGHCAVSHRLRNGPAYRYFNLGLRLAQVP